MRRLCLTLFALGCNSGDANPEDFARCAGDHAGTYDGDDAGAALATLGEDGALVVTFGTGFGDVDAAATVADDGAVEGCEGDVCIEGTYDFEACAASGTWTNAPLSLAGDWALEKL